MIRGNKWDSSSNCAGFMIKVMHKCQQVTTVALHLTKQKRYSSWCVCWRQLIRPGDPKPKQHFWFCDSLDWDQNRGLESTSLHIEHAACQQIFLTPDWWLWHMICHFHSQPGKLLIQLSKTRKWPNMQGKLFLFTNYSCLKLYCMLWHEMCHEASFRDGRKL